MSYARFAVFKLTWCRALLILALPTACAVEVKPEFEDTGETNLPAGTAGTSAGGTHTTAGSSGLPSSGSTSVGGSVASNPFGGTASSGSASGGTASSGSSNGGSPSGGASGGSAAGGKAGSSSGGSAGSSAGGSSGGTGTGTCACPTKKTWVDNSNLAFGPGDCLEVAGAVYLYTGAKAQTWANLDCNPSKQLAWCSDVGADYKFMLCK